MGSSVITPLPFVMNGQIGGHYSVGINSGLIVGPITAGGAASQLVSIRWQDTRLLMIPMSLELEILCTAFSTGVSLDLAAYVARKFTTNASGTGSTVITNPTRASVASMRQSILISNGEFRVAGTAPLTSGTQTLDDEPFATRFVQIKAAQDVTREIVMYRRDEEEHPIIIGNNEGIVVRLNTINLPASNTIKVGGRFKYVEVAGMPFAA